MKKRSLKFGVAGLCVVALATGGWAFIANMAKANAEKPQIKTAAVRRGAVVRSVSDTGVLQPLTTVEVKSNVGGEVVQMAVEEGDYVSAGQLIARIDTSDAQLALDQSKADLASANAKVNQAKTQLEIQRTSGAASVESAAQALEAAKKRLAQAEHQAEAQPKLTNANITQAESGVASAEASLRQTKVALGPQKVAAAQASHDQAAANADFATRDLARQRELFSQGFVSRKTVETAEQQQRVTQAQLETAKRKLETVKDEVDADIRAAEAKLAQAEATLDTARANAMQDDIKRQDVDAARAAVKQAEANLATARANLAVADVRGGDITAAMAGVSRSEASLKNAQTTLNYTTITAPRAGVVVKKYVEQGTVVSGSRSSTGAGVTLVEIADTTVMQAVMNIDETDIGKIRKGQEVDVTVDAFPDELYGGVVTKIAPRTVTDQNVTTVPVTVVVRANNNRLKPGMGVNCEFIIEKKRDVLMVPSEAVKDGDGGQEVTVYDGKVQKKIKVRTGMVGNETTEILEESTDQPADGQPTERLEAGQQVITAIIDPKKKPANTNRQPGTGMPPGMGGPTPGMGGGRR